MSKKVCKKCKVFVEPGQMICPECKNNQFTESWKGKAIVFKPEESEIAKHMKITKKGSYAIKTR